MTRASRGLPGRAAVTAWALAWVASAGAASASAQEIVTGDETYTITFNEVDGTRLEEFIWNYQRLSGKVIHYDPKDLQGEDAIIHQLGTHVIPKKRLDIFFGAVLRNMDFLLVHYGPLDAGFWSLRRLTQQARGGASNQLRALAQIVSPSDLDQLGDNPGVLVTTSYTTKYLPARDAVNTLQPYFADTITDAIRNIEGTDTILMTGFANTLGGMYRLLKEIDQKPTDYYPNVVRRKLLHAVADEIQPVLEDLIRAYEGGTRSPGAPGGRRGAQGGGQLAPSQEPEPSVIAEHRTNSLLVTAGEDTLDKILSWIDDLDVEVEPSGVYVYRLRNSKAEELQQTISDIMDASQQSRGGGARPGGPAGGAAPPSGVTSSSEQPVTIVADNHTNSLVISASKTRYAQILEIVRKLDVRRAQVLIQVALVEVAESLGSALGVELTSVRLNANDKSLFGVTSFGLTDLIDTDGDGFPDAKALPDPLAAGLTGGVFDPQDFPLPFVLNALNNTTDANVLSMPTILTNDNEQAQITATDAVPYTTVNQGQNSDQTSFGGNEQAGIDLTISPTISAGGYLSLSINLTVSSFTGPATASGVPPSQERTISASVTIPDGHTMIIGGVLQNDQRRDEQKVPILGDIPFLGSLFRNTSENSNKTNLYFFLTPHIIADDFAVLDELTRLHMEEASRLGGKVEMLNRFNFLKEGDEEVQQISEILLEKVFELPSYASVADGTSATISETPPPVDYALDPSLYQR